jgi:hypothetical protein
MQAVLARGSLSEAGYLGLKILDGGPHLSQFRIPAAPSGKTPFLSRRQDSNLGRQIGVEALLCYFKGSACHASKIGAAWSGRCIVRRDRFQTVSNYWF